MKNSRHLRILLFALAIGNPLFAQQTLHLVISANPYPEETIHIGCQQDRVNSVELFKAVEKLAHVDGYDLSVAFHYPDYGKQSVANFLDGLPVGADDTVIFIFSGHGLQDTAGGAWPLLYYCAEPTERIDYAGCALSLETVHRSLVHRGVRMSLAIASSCNHNPLLNSKQQDLVTILHVPTEAGINPVRAEKLHRSFKLFTEFRGHILASASQSGREAYLNDELGSFFLHAFKETIMKAVSANAFSSWEELFRSTGERARRGYGADQHLQFWIATQD